MIPASTASPDGKEDKEFISRESMIRQVLSGLVVALSTLMTGFTSAWPVALPKLQETSQNFQVTDQDVAWLVSLQGIVGVFTSTVSGHLVEYFGPKKLLVINLLPTFGLWMLMAFTPHLILLYLSRVGLCISTYLIKSFFQAYIAELCQPQIRGAIAALPELIISIGILVIYILANFFSYETVTAVCAVPFLPLLIMTLFIPESPYWLVRRNRMAEARASLRRLRGKKENVETEMNTITSTNKVQVSPWAQIRELRKREHNRPVLLVLMILALREISGQTAIFSYSVYMFRQAGVELDAFLCTVLIGCVRVVSAFMAVATLDRVGRRPLLIGSTIVCGLSELISGCTLLLDAPGTSWVPLAGLLLYVASYGIGQAGVPWILMGELLPTPVRSVGSAIITLSYCSLMFIVSYVFFWLLEYLKLGGTFCMFAFSNILLAVILCKWLPETRGRSLHDLETAFKKPQKSNLYDDEEVTDKLNS